MEHPVVVTAAAASTSSKPPPPPPPPPPPQDRPTPHRRALDVGDDMVLEYVAFRGFTETFRSFSMERLDDVSRRGSFDATFAVDALLRNVDEMDVAGIVESWDFVESKFLAQLDAELGSHAEALRCGLFRYFCVTAVSRGESQKAIELLSTLARRDIEDAAKGSAAASFRRGRRRRQSWEDDGDFVGRPRGEEQRALWALSSSDDDDDEDGEQDEDDPREAYRSRCRNGDGWREWFAMPHLPEPSNDPVFRLYFTRRWQDDLKLSLRNFLAAVFARAPPPKLLLLEKWHRTSAQKALRSALAESKADCVALRSSLANSNASRDALASTVKTLVAHCHQETKRDSTRLRRGGGLFDDEDDDPRDAYRLARDAGARALDIAKRCAPGERGASLDDDDDEGAASSSVDATSSSLQRDDMLLSLCEATNIYLDLLKGTSTASDVAAAAASPLLHANKEDGDDTLLK